MAENITTQDLEKRVIDSPTGVFTKVYTVNNPHGIHARPSTKISEAVSKYAGGISFKFKRNGETVEVNPKSVIDIMCNAIGPGTEITFYFRNGKPDKNILKTIEAELNREYKFP